ncbi:hypothetical protein WMF38_29495 [Sorangium sp. So ce118]
MSSTPAVHSGFAPQEGCGSREALHVDQRVQRGRTVGPLIREPFTGVDAAAECAPSGHTGAVLGLGDETGGNH